MKKPKYLEIEMFDEVDKVCFFISSYSNNGNMAIELITDEDEPYCGLSVNLDFLMPGFAFVNTNSEIKFEKILKKNKWAKPTGTKRSSGYCTYPLYEFDLKKMKPYIHPMSDYFMLED